MKGRESISSPQNLLSPLTTCDQLSHSDRVAGQPRPHSLRGDSASELIESRLIQDISHVCEVREDAKSALKCETNKSRVWLARLPDRGVKDSHAKGYRMPLGRNLGNIESKKCIGDPWRGGGGR